ncbi:islet cell autoantigen 1-like isoform X1 [Ciona intestinalis]
MSMSKYDSSGYSGQSYDRNVFEANLSTVNKLQRDFWNAKQVLRKKLGKAEDLHIVASDAELDAKLDLFLSVQNTCADLIKATEKYQNCICVLSRDENAMGRFLKDQGSLDKTAAGKMMAAAGKAQCFTAQQRLNLRSPLGRLHHDIETFRYRAIGDCVLSVNHMEEARTHYRASLRWMQDISSNLDPEQYKKLEKFRKVQTEVRLNKEKFDRLKWAVCQKVDLLCASRSNLFSNTLVPYQNEVLKFWEKTARTLSAVQENIKDYQHYEFKLLKGLNPIQDLEEKGEDEEEKGKKQNQEEEEENGDHQLISLDDPEKLGESLEQEVADIDITNHDKDSLLNFYEGNLEDVYLDKMIQGEFSPRKSLLGDLDQGTKNEEDTDNLLLGEMNDTDFQKPTKEDLDLWNDILGDEDNTNGGELEEQWHSVFGEFTSHQSPQPTITQVETSTKDDILLMEDKPEQPVQPPNTGGGYLPSQLMDLMMTAPSQPQMMSQPAPYMQQGMMGPGGFPGQNMGPQMMAHQPPSYQSMFGTPAPHGNPQQINQSMQQVPKPQSKKDNKGNMSAWYNLFAELDPLQNPDALGKKKESGREKETGGSC